MAKVIPVSIFFSLIFFVALQASHGAVLGQSENSSPICGANSSKSCCNSFIVRDGFLRLKENFTIGDIISIEMKIKPRTKYGVLLWVAGQNDFLILQLINGSVEFSVDNGDGLIHTSMKLPYKIIKDGGWYEISAYKHASMISLTVDFKDFGITLGTGQTASTNTSGPLLIGGVPKDEPILGLRTDKPFMGCIKDVEISGEKVQLDSPADFRGKVHFKPCPVEA